MSPEMQTLLRQQVLDMKNRQNSEVAELLGQLHDLRQKHKQQLQWLTEMHDRVRADNPEPDFNLEDDLDAYHLEDDL